MDVGDRSGLGISRRGFDTEKRSRDNKANHGALGRSRTCDLPLRRGTLYPAELPGPYTIAFKLYAVYLIRFGL